MKTLIKNLLLLTGLFITSCVSRQEKIDGEVYSTVVYYNDNFEYHSPEREQTRTDRLLSDDTLYIFFETEFESDTVEIKIKDRDTKTLYLTTSYIGLADAAQYGGIESIDKIEIKKNNGRLLTINLNDKAMNLWAVNFYNDTLRAERRKYLSWYE